MAELPEETYAQYAFLAQRILDPDEIGRLPPNDFGTMEMCIRHAQMRLEANLKAIRFSKRQREAAARREVLLKEKVAKAEEKIRDKAARAEERIREAAEKHRTKVAEKKRKPSRSPPQA
jgi:hypothetical protein